MVPAWERSESERHRVQIAVRLHVSYIKIRLKHVHMFTHKLAAPSHQPSAHTQTSHHRQDAQRSTQPTTTTTYFGMAPAAVSPHSFTRSVLAHLSSDTIQSPYSPSHPTQTITAASLDSSLHSSPPATSDDLVQTVATLDTEIQAIKVM